MTGKINYLFYVNNDPYEDEKINGNEKAEIVKYSRKNLYSKNIFFQVFIQYLNLNGFM